MSRFIGFLSESKYKGESRSKSITADEAIDLLQKNCKESIKYKPTLYRGYNKSTEDYNYIDPSKSIRVSANTANYYTLFMDNDSYWKEYPKRSRSIIGATSLERLSGWPTVLKIYPYDGAKIGVCPKQDIWFSFKSKMYALDEINASITMATKYKTIMNYKDLVEAFKFIDMIKNDIDDKYVIDIFKNIGYYKSDKSFYQVFKKYMSPVLNNFKLVGCDYKTKGNYEFWTDSQCVMLRMNDLNKDPLDDLLNN